MLTRPMPIVSRLIKGMIKVMMVVGIYDDDDDDDESDYRADDVLVNDVMVSITM